MLLFIFFALLTLFLLGTGYTLWRGLGGGSQRTHLETLFTYFTFGSIVSGWLALVLTALGQFSLPLWLILIVLLSSAVTLVKKYQQPTSFTPFSDRARFSLPRAAVPEYILLVMWGITAVFLFGRPHEMIYGAADAGVYVNLSAHIAQTGSLNIVDPILRDLDPALYPAFLRTMTNAGQEVYFWSSGLIVPDESGRILPPFYHLFPVWQAIGYAALGVSGALLITGFWMWWASTAVYLTLRRLLPQEQWWLAFAGLIGLSFSALQVWFARYPTTEALTQFLFWAGLWAFIAWGEEGEGDYAYSEWRLGLLAGLAWGATFLVRIDTFFVGVIPAVLLLILLSQRRLGKAHLPFFAALILLPLHSLIHAALFTPFYLQSVFGYVFLVAGQYVLPLTVLAGVGVGVLVVLWARGEAWLGRLGWLVRPLKVVAITLILLWWIYNWFVRPAWGEPLIYVNPWDNITVEQWNHENLVRLGWYLSPLGMGLAALGMGRLIWRLERKTWAFVLLGGLFTLLYVWNIRSNGVQVYAMRRYVPVVAPFLLSTAVLFIGWVGQAADRWRQGGAVFLTAVWLVALGLSARGFVAQVDYPGLIEETAHIAGQLPPGSVLLFNQANDIGIGDHLGVPLTLIHGHHAFVLFHLDALDEARFREAIAGWQAAGRAVYWVDIPGGQAWPLGDVPLAYRFAYSIPIRNLEGSFTHKPTAVFTAVWPSDVYEIQPIP